eukprot:1182796-Rhodomonas_salina.1
MTITIVVDEKPQKLTQSASDSESDESADSDYKPARVGASADEEDSDDLDFSAGSTSESTSESEDEAAKEAAKKEAAAKKAAAAAKKAAAAAKKAEAAAAAPKKAATAQGPGSRKRKQMEELNAVSSANPPRNERRVEEAKARKFGYEPRLVMQVIRLWVTFLVTSVGITRKERKRMMDMAKDYLGLCDKRVDRPKDIRDPEDGGFVVYTSDTDSSDTKRRKSKSVGDTQEPDLTKIRDAMGGQKKTRDAATRMAVAMFNSYRGVLDEKRIKDVCESLFDEFPLSFPHATAHKLRDLMAARLCARPSMCHSDPFRVFQLSYLQLYASQLSLGEFKFTGEQLDLLLEKEIAMAKRTKVDKGPEGFDGDLSRRDGSNTESDGSEGEVSTDDSDTEMPEDESKQTNTTIYPDS